MSLVLKALEYAVSAAFIALGVLTVRDWLSGRDRRRGYLALALGLLGLVSLISRLHELTGYRSEVLTVLSLSAFLGSAYALLMFRHPVPSSVARHGPNRGGGGAGGSGPLRPPGCGPPRTRR